MQYDDSNEMFRLAAELVEHSSQNIYLTGKAGTGKTTFLKYIREHSGKKIVITAPTGVAAINAGGVTLHSFFQLPFGAYVPDFGHHDPSANINDKHSLLTSVRLNAEKKELILELDLLIIDEVSMVRADLLDAIDQLLRHYRKNQNQPFGGLQVLFIGDLFQLPPVISDTEWGLLQSFYSTPFFFSSKALTAAPPLYIELNRIYRQKDQVFIELLNKIRHNTAGPSELHILNERFRNGFDPGPDEKYITLTTHNARADNINSAQLDKLQGKKHSFPATIEGEFTVRASPADENLYLKEGAQVMFIKNDSGNDRKFYNGKLAVISRIEQDKITVSFPGNEPELELKRESWKNIRYHLDKARNELEEEELGSFTQFPIRLAWAITIHKSQGLTFEKAIIDAGQSFAPGQVYVALSRCTNLDGLVLYSKIGPSSILTDERVITFSRQERSANELQKLLAAGRQRYMTEALLKTFDWNRTLATVRDFLEDLPGKKIPDPAGAKTLIGSVSSKAMIAADTAEKFRKQLDMMLLQNDEGTDMALDRTTKAIVWFTETICNDMLIPLSDHDLSLAKATRVKAYRKELLELRLAFWIQLQKTIKARYGDRSFIEEQSKYDHYNPSLQTDLSKTQRPVKGGSGRESLEMFVSGIDISTIAKTRNLAESTVGGHLAMFVRTGELDIHQLVPPEALQSILDVANETKDHSIASIRERMDPGMPYYYIRATVNHMLLMSERHIS